MSFYPHALDSLLVANSFDQCGIASKDMEAYATIENIFLLVFPLVILYTPVGTLHVLAHFTFGFKFPFTNMHPNPLENWTTFKTYFLSDLLEPSLQGSKNIVYARDRSWDGRFVQRCVYI